ncbi:conserved membrane hypothetical protein [Flavobacterium sp. 9AF]|uniref:hypothetical protein n=1 Tax=Flavobacterium sp. 9AF TaxID=2653142 RepID=UPI0012EF79EC|nr:hypothetical protein [Flavobacterium sp. 9AF]VXB52654.1 conserved membrane hypothetical protein [Flavobacterium sp. 9AF]
MKRLILILGLIILNFLTFDYLTNHFTVQYTLGRLMMTFIASIIAVSIVCFFITSCKYILKLYIEQSSISFKTIYFDLFLNISIAIYILLIFAAIYFYI